MAYPQTATGYVSGSMTVPMTIGSEPQAISVMQQARMRLVETTTQIHQQIGALETRLASVCGSLNRPPQPDGVNQKIEIQPSEHRGFLEDQTRSLVSAIDRLDVILNRLEL
ncbi:MAG TPA: hypothetical protein VF443_08420 [Nitrospira sp.]